MRFGRDGEAWSDSLEQADVREEEEEAEQRPVGGST